MNFGSVSVIQPHGTSRTRPELENATAGSRLGNGAHTPCKPGYTQQNISSADCTCRQRQLSSLIIGIVVPKMSSKNTRSAWEVHEIFNSPTLPFVFDVLKFSIHSIQRAVSLLFGRITPAVTRYPVDTMLVELTWVDIESVLNSSHKLTTVNDFFILQQSSALHPNHIRTIHSDGWLRVHFLRVCKEYIADTLRVPGDGNRKIRRRCRDGTIEVLVQELAPLPSITTKQVDKFPPAMKSARDRR